jgi:hypothetical protein
LGSGNPAAQDHSASAGGALGRGLPAMADPEVRGLPDGAGIGDALGCDHPGIMEQGLPATAGGALGAATTRHQCKASMAASGRRHATLMEPKSSW